MRHLQHCKLALSAPTAPDSIVSVSALAGHPHYCCSPVKSPTRGLQLALGHVECCASNFANCNPISARWRRPLRPCCQDAIDPSRHLLRANSYTKRFAQKRSRSRSPMNAWHGRIGAGKLKCILIAAGDHWAGRQTKTNRQDKSEPAAPHCRLARDPHGRRCCNWSANTMPIMSDSGWLRAESPPSSGKA